MSAFSATMIALYVRDVQGYGQQVDVSAMETMAVAQIHSSIQHQFGRTPSRRESPWSRRKTAGSALVWSAVCARIPGRASAT